MAARATQHWPTWPTSPASGIAAGCRRDSERYYRRELDAKREALEAMRDDLRGLVDELQAESFYCDADATVRGLRTSIAQLGDVLDAVARARTALPAP